MPLLGTLRRELHKMVRQGKEGRGRARRTLVTDLVPSEMACLASSPGRMSRTDVWISRDEMVDFFEYAASSGGRVSGWIGGMGGGEHALDASVAIRSKISLTNEFKMAIALFEIPVSGWTCLRTASASEGNGYRHHCHSPL